jgi:hypothetical protein
VLLAKHKMSFVAHPLKYEKHNKKILWITKLHLKVRNSRPWLSDDKATLDLSCHHDRRYPRTTSSPQVVAMKKIVSHSNLTSTSDIVKCEQARPMRMREKEEFHGLGVAARWRHKPARTSLSCQRGEDKISIKEDRWIVCWGEACDREEKTDQSRINLPFLSMQWG